MAAVPKKKPSKTRQRQKRSVWMNEQKALFVRDLVVCKHCGRKHTAHRVCPHCGYYRDRQVLDPQAQVKRVSE